VSIRQLPCRSDGLGSSSRLRPVDFCVTGFGQHRHSVRQICSGCGPLPPAAEITVMDIWQSLGSAIDFGASGRYQGITDSAGLAKNTVELHMQCSITAGHPLR
jgi:hypothetical protein